MLNIEPGSYCKGCEQSSGCGFHDATRDKERCPHHYCSIGQESLVSLIKKGAYRLDKNGYARIQGGAWHDTFSIDLATGNVFACPSEAHYVPVGITLDLD